MRVAIIGAGLSGSTMARLLKDRGHEVVIFEKMGQPGGLCSTAEHEGKLYQLFGPHNLHTDSESVVAFLRRFSAFNNYIHRAGTCVDGRVFPYPISRKTIELLAEKDRIVGELSRLPKAPDMANFEACVVSVIGETLYKKFIENFTAKFWGVSPKEMDAAWAPQRIEIRDDDRLGYFKNEWQGMPVQGYTQLFEKMIEGIPVHYNTEIKDYRDLKDDLVISTIPIDELLGFRYGRLAYRGISFTIRFDEAAWENTAYGWINFPGSEVAYTRKCNYSLCYPDGPGGTYIVGYDFPCNTSRMYPLLTPESRERFKKYLAHLVKTGNLLSIGRLGLFRYYDMDEAMKWCLDNVESVEKYPALAPEERMRWLSR